MDESAQSNKIAPGQSQNFIYVGDFVPNQISVANVGNGEATFRLTSLPPGWVYYGQITHGGLTASLLVQFPSGQFTVNNSGSNNIVVAGNGIRPIGPAD